MKSLVLFAVAAMVAACGGGGAGPTVPATAGGPLTTVGPTQAGAATPVAPAPAPGAGTVSVTLTGGPDAGTYTGSEDPLCSIGLVGPQGWGVQYSTATAGAGQLSSLQLIAPASGQVAMNVRFKMTVTIGVLFEGNDYDVTLAEDEDESSGTGSAQVTDNGTTAVIHATGTTEDGVAIDATVNCPTVIRN